jgi:hypothetical protein
MPLNFTIFWTLTVAFCSKYLLCIYAAGLMPGSRDELDGRFTEKFTVFLPGAALDWKPTPAKRPAPFLLGISLRPAWKATSFIPRHHGEA